MKPIDALQFARECVEAELDRIRMDANLYDKGIVDYPTAKRSSERRKELIQVICHLDLLVNKWQSDGHLG